MTKKTTPAPTDEQLAGSGNNPVSRYNPIIGDVCGDTLYNASCAVAFLARFHNVYADAGFQCESIVENLAGHESRGLAVLCECIEAALNFEMGRT